jgi:hypothetical protein
MANITRFDRFSQMVTPRQAMDRLFEGSFVNTLTLGAYDGEATGPALHVHESGDDGKPTA